MLSDICISGSAANVSNSSGFLQSTGNTEIRAYIHLFTRGPIFLRRTALGGLSIYDSFSGFIIQSVSDFLCDKINTMLGGWQDFALHCI